MRLSTYLAAAFLHDQLEKDETAYNGFQVCLGLYCTRSTYSLKLHMVFEELVYKLCITTVCCHV